MIQLDAEKYEIAHEAYKLVADRYKQLNIPLYEHTKDVALNGCTQRGTEEVCLGCASLATNVCVVVNEVKTGTINSDG